MQLPNSLFHRRKKLLYTLFVNNRNVARQLIKEQIIANRLTSLWEKVSIDGLKRLLFHNSGWTFLQHEKQQN